ncbi:MAG: hypothetical protein R6X20_09540 [Phycisphaerae bacterium]
MAWTGPSRAAQRTLILAAALTACLLAPAASARAKDGPWPAPVPGFEPVRPGEHPRLFFREADLADLRARAATPEGRAILERLKVVLGGGDTMPAPPGKSRDFPDGVYTMSHAAGFGLLHQLTGEQKYADLGRECFEWAFQGKPNHDSRYSFMNPNGALRAGPSLGWYAVGYDLCYDGWDDAYRRKVALAIQDYDRGRNKSLAELVRGSRHNPRSNHWGMQVGGGALALLAIMHDPGVDMGKIGPLLETSEKAMIRLMTEGWGDGGYFTEGDGTGSMSSHIAFLPALQAWRVAAGKDFVTPRPHAQWMSLKWMLGTVVRDGRTFFPSRDGYPHNVWSRRGVSGGGYFGLGFGVATPRQKAAWLWFYNHFFREHDEKAGAPFDTISPYPHHTVLAFVNWPFGMEEANPAECIPQAVCDHKFGWCLMRNRWQDHNDIVVSVLTTRPRKHTKRHEIGPVWILGLGKKETWGNLRGKVTHFEAAADGSAVVAVEGGGCLAVDFSEASGAEAMLVLTGTGEAGKTVEAGGRTFSFHFVTSGREPAPKADGETVVVGDQAVALKDGRIVLKHWAKR